MSNSAKGEMSRRELIAGSVGAVVATTLGAQAQPSSAPAAAPEEKIDWLDVNDLTVEGRAWTDLESPFDRFPKKAKGVIRQAVWDLSKCSAGICVRFNSDSPLIHVDYTVTNAGLAMFHMPATGMSGLDLYAFTESGWRWFDVTKPTQAHTKAALAKSTDRATRDYLMYLPLYNGVTSLRIGVEEGSKISPSPKRETRPVVYYGTSIAQGGCASRPGMAHVAIIGRMLNREMINLGFSGNGWMDPEVADLLTEINAECFVIDCLPNCSKQQVETRTTPLIEKLRKAHPSATILMVTDPDWCNSPWSSSQHKTQLERRAAYATIVKEMMKNDSLLHYLDLGNLFAPSNEGTVDGIHPNDLGMMQYAERVGEELKKIMKL
jgi:lysophospholipase L1-like esterase